MDYDEQHRICEQEFELDDAYTVAMDVMPEHWKEEADSQLTYLRHMHICSTSMLLLAVLICFSLLDEAGFPCEIDGGIPFQPSGSSFGRFPCSESFNTRGMDYHNLETYFGSTFLLLQVFSKPEIRSIGILEPRPIF